MRRDREAQNIAATVIATTLEMTVNLCDGRFEFLTSPHSMSSPPVFLQPIVSLSEGCAPRHVRDHRPRHHLQMMLRRCRLLLSQQMAVASAAIEAEGTNSSLSRRRATPIWWRRCSGTTLGGGTWITALAHFGDQLASGQHLGADFPSRIGMLFRHESEGSSLPPAAPRCSPATARKFLRRFAKLFRSECASPTIAQLTALASHGMWQEALAAVTLDVRRLPARDLHELFLGDGNLHAQTAQPSALHCVSTGLLLASVVSHRRYIELVAQLAVGACGDAGRWGEAVRLLYDVLAPPERSNESLLDATAAGSDSNRRNALIAVALARRAGIPVRLLRNGDDAVLLTWRANGSEAVQPGEDPLAGRPTALRSCLDNPLARTLSQLASSQAVRWLAQLGTVSLDAVTRSSMASLCVAAAVAGGHWSMALAEFSRAMSPELDRFELNQAMSNVTHGRTSSIDRPNELHRDPFLEPSAVVWGIPPVTQDVCCAVLRVAMRRGCVGLASATRLLNYIQATWGSVDEDLGRCAQQATSTSARSSTVPWLLQARPKLPPTAASPWFGRALQPLAPDEQPLLLDLPPAPELSSLEATATELAEAGRWLEALTCLTAMLREVEHSCRSTLLAERTELTALDEAIYGAYAEPIARGAWLEALQLLTN